MRRERSRITSYNVCYTKLLRIAGCDYWPPALQTQIEQLQSELQAATAEKVQLQNQVAAVTKAKDDLQTQVDDLSRAGRDKSTMIHRITSYNVCYTKLLRGRTGLAAAA